METVQISVRIDRALECAIERYCNSRGLVINHFIQGALIDRLEDLSHLGREPTRPLSEVLTELRLDGNL